jgi:hypothetical protein
MFDSFITEVKSMSGFPVKASGAVCNGPLACQKLLYTLTEDTSNRVFFFYNYHHYTNTN